MKKMTTIYKHILIFTLFLLLLGSTNSINAFEINEVMTEAPTLPKEEYNPIKSIKISEKKIRLNVKDKRYLKISVKYKNKNKKKDEPYLWYSSNPKVATVTKDGVVTGLKKGVAYISFKGMKTKIKARCKVTVAKTKYIAFTFDDGPSKYTKDLLNTLDKYDSKATFFVLGDKIKGRQNTLKRANNLGMEIGSHSYSHPNLNVISESKVKNEINKTEDLINETIGHKPTLFRPPYGNFNNTVKKYCKVPMMYWTVDFEDWDNRNTKYVSKQILKQAEDGEIILLHDIYKTTVKGFKKALPKLRKKGYELVTVSELYKIKNVKLKDSEMHYGPNNAK